MLGCSIKGMLHIQCNLYEQHNVDYHRKKKHAHSKVISMNQAIKHTLYIKCMATNLKIHVGMRLVGYIQSLEELIGIRHPS